MRFKSTFNIFKDNGEVYDPNYFDTPFLQLPPKIDWDYSRELQIEDVDIWEVIYESGGGIGVYASWSPYAEFYLIRVGWFAEKMGHGAETYYGPGALSKVKQRMIDLNIPVNLNIMYISEENMWLYS